MRPDVDSLLTESIKLVCGFVQVIREGYVEMTCLAVMAVLTAFKQKEAGCKGGR